MLLEIRDLSVRYGKSINAVQGASLAVEQGELISLVGQNGAGKSSILKAVAGLIPVLSGEILVDGKPVSRKKYSLIAEKIAYVPEDRGIFTSLTVGENLRLGAVSRRDRREIDSDVEDQLDRFPILRKYWSRGASLLSGGEQQQLAIARALMLRPRLLLLDEPTLGLAPLIVDLIFDIIEDLRRSGVTILLVEQNAARSIEVADRSYVIQAPGKIIGMGSAWELAENAKVVDYLGFSPIQTGDEK